MFKRKIAVVSLVLTMMAFAIVFLAKPFSTATGQAPETSVPIKLPSKRLSHEVSDSLIPQWFPEITLPCPAPDPPIVL